MQRAQRRLRRLSSTFRHHITPAGTGPVYVFHHIPKTGGSSVDRVLPCWFYRIRDKRPRRNPSDWTAGHEASPPVDLSTLRANDCLSGHWPVPGEYLHERYPEVLAESRYRLFAFVREPLELKLSLFSWERRQGKPSERLTIEEELLQRPNFLAARFPCSEDDYEKVLSRYFFIGLTERLQESFNLLADRVDRPRLSLPHVNRSRSAKDRVHLSAAFRRDFRAVNHLDYLVYEYCRDRLGRE